MLCGTGRRDGSNPLSAFLPSTSPFCTKRPGPRFLPQPACPACLLVLPVCVCLVGNQRKGFPLRHFIHGKLPNHSGLGSDGSSSFSACRLPEAEYQRWSRPRFNSLTSGSSGRPHWLKSCLRNLLSVLYVDQPALNQGGPAGACLPQHLYFVRTQACEARLGSQKKRFLSLCALVSRMKDESSTEQKVTNRF